MALVLRRPLLRPAEVHEVTQAVDRARAATSGEGGGAAGGAAAAVPRVFVGGTALLRREDFCAQLLAPRSA